MEDKGINPRKDHFQQIQYLDREVVIVVVSDTLAALKKGEEIDAQDVSGGIAHQLLQKAGYKEFSRLYVADEVREIQQLVLQKVEEKVALVLLIGGTGIAERDVTPEAVKEILDKELPGFAEEFRRRSVDKTKSVYPLFSRSFLGIKEETVIASFPGSSGAIRDGLDLLLKMLPHMFSLIWK